MLTAAELSTLCWQDPDPAVVLGIDDGSSPLAAVAAVVRATGPVKSPAVGSIRLLAVAPEAQRQGLGLRLVAAAEQWLLDAGATELRIGGEAPFYLWPGVDVRWTAALCLFERTGYQPEGAALNLSCASVADGRPRPPASTFDVRTVRTDEEIHAVLVLVGRLWPWWVAETSRALERSHCVAAFDASTCDGSDAGLRVAGFGCHSVNRAGWLGPIGTDPDRRAGGVGSAVLDELCRRIEADGHPTVEIAWIGPVGFYARTVGATVSRVFQTLVKRPAAAPRPVGARATAGS